MHYSVRKFNKEDYTTLVGWWKKSGWTNIPPYEVLPTDGYISDNACLFAYHASNAPFAFIGFPATNKDCDRKQKFEELKVCLNACREDAEKKGIKFFISYNQIPSLIDTFVSQGFEKAETNCTVMMYSNSNFDFIKEDEQLPSK